MDDPTAAAMPAALYPTLGEIRRTFDAEIAALGGTVRDAFDDGERLFLRAVLPDHDTVGPRDALQAGVALRTAGADVLAVPYLFRAICSNGAIRAHALEARQVERTSGEAIAPPTFESTLALTAIGTAARDCAAATVMADGMREVRAASETPMDSALALLPMLVQLAPRMSPALVRMVLERFDRTPDPGRSVFGVMNAVTSVARDTRDPELRWQLEAVGGEVGALLVPQPRRPSSQQSCAHTLAGQDP